MTPGPAICYRRGRLQDEPVSAIARGLSRPKLWATNPQYSAPFLRAVVLTCGFLSSASAFAAATTNDEHPPDAIEVFRCTFDENWDANFDLWPDRWVRQSGPDYPRYVGVQIRDDDDAKAFGGRTLEIELDGSSAAVSSPPIRIVSRFSYLLMAKIKLTSVESQRRHTRHRFL